MKARMPSYINPVYPHYFADPFVLHHQGSYYAYGTGLGGHSDQAGHTMVFEVLHSTDLVNWQSLGGALELPFPDQALHYWAPEVAFDGKHFYLYYSAGVEDKGHRIRLAVAKTAQGPFKDQGLELTPHEPFAIDANPFQDEDGQWYLFFAKDFLDGPRVGTALAVDRLLDMSRLAGETQTVLRASSDWQIYLKKRLMYGSIYDWHTLEGPFVIKRNGRYYCFYSGGNWQQDSYGVSYAVAEHPLGPWHEPPGGPLILRTVPGKVIGPGHNSVVVGPDGHDYIVYHAWDAQLSARRMCIDPLNWTPDGPRTVGPTYMPQPTP